MPPDKVQARVCLPKDPQLLALARFLSGDKEFIAWWIRGTALATPTHLYEIAAPDVVRAVAHSLAIQVWGLAKALVQGDLIPDAKIEDLDELAGAPSVGLGLERVGWAERRLDGVLLPKFGKHDDIPPRRRRKSDAERAKDARKRKRKGTGDHPPPGPIPDFQQIPEGLRTDRFAVLWLTWMKHRAEIRHALKPTTASYQLKKLAAWGEPRAVAALEWSLSQGYQGIFEERRHGGIQRPGGGVGHDSRVDAQPGKYDGIATVRIGEATSDGAAEEQAPPRGKPQPGGDCPPTAGSSSQPGLWD